MKIYLTNSATVAAVARGRASAESRACVGPGPVYSIMRYPRAELGEDGDGRVLSLVPPAALAAPAIEAKRRSDAGEADAADAWRDYEAALLEVWSEHAGKLAPEVLAWGRPDPRGVPWDGEHWARGGAVEDGATLICACSRKAAADRRCHRVIAAELLAGAGWDVVLDGRPLSSRAAS